MRAIDGSDGRVVLHIRDSNGIYGAERIILNLGKHADRNKFDVKLLCMRRSDGRSEQLIERAIRLEIPVIPVDVRRRFDLKAIREIRRVIREKHVVVVHSHDFKSDFFALLATVGLGVKRVATAHGSTRDSLVKKLYLFLDEWLVYRRFDSIIAVSERLQQKLTSFLRPGKVSVIRNGIDISLLAADKQSADMTPLNIPAGNKVFAVIGRLFPDKGHRYFLQAFAEVLGRRSDVMALIIGAGPSKDAIAEQIKALGLEHAVSLCGSRSDMFDLYRRIDYLVIPSLTEGLPNVLLEALASKVPVLATSVGDIPVLVRDGSSGYLVPPADAPALAGRMIDLIVHPEKAHLMAEEGHRIFQEGYTAQRMVRETESLYERLLCA